MKKNILTVVIVTLSMLAVLSCASTGGGGGAQKEWTFDDAGKGTDGWYLTKAEFWQYTGDIDLGYDDSAFGDGMLRLDLDFSNPANQNDWSEPKLAIDFLRAVGLRGIGSFTFDFYFDPSARNQGQFQTKIYTEYGGGKIDTVQPLSSSGETMPNGFVKVQASIPIEPVSTFINSIRFSVVGSNTDYVGPVYIDNIRFVPVGE
jgi:mannan endo-1,4-beta-mannosidase